MSGTECRVFYKASDPATIQEEISRYRKYVDGLAFDEENLGIFKNVLDAVMKSGESQYDVVLIGTKEGLLRFLSSVNIEGVHMLIATSGLSEVAELRQACGKRRNVEFGVYVAKPTVNLAQFARFGIRFMIMPPALIRGRLISEAKARRVEIIAYLVNDVAIYARLSELGIDGVITTDPTIKREAKKLLRL